MKIATWTRGIKGGAGDLFRILATKAPQTGEAGDVRQHQKFSFSLCFYDYDPREPRRP